MSSKAEIARMNGAKSSGPITPEGKAISARNSTKHGLTSSRVVLPHESQQEYDDLESSIFKRFKPADAVERELVAEMAASRWRLRRVEAMESALYKKAMREQQALLGPDADAEDVRDAAYVDVAESKTMRMLSRHAAQLRRSYEKAWRELEKLQQEDVEEDIQNEPTGHLTDAMLDFLTAPPTPGRSSIPAPPTLAAMAKVQSRVYEQRS